MLPLLGDIPDSVKKRDVPEALSHRVDLSHWTNSTKDWFHGHQGDCVVRHVAFYDVAVKENETLAFVRCNVTFAAHTPSSEKLSQIANRLTFVLRKENDIWRISPPTLLPADSRGNGKGIFTRN